MDNGGSLNESSGLFVRASRLYYTASQVLVGIISGGVRSDTCRGIWLLMMINTNL